MGISGDTSVKCISNVTSETGQVVLATNDGRIFRYDRMKENFELISDVGFHDGSRIKEVDELCVLLSNRQQAAILAKVKTTNDDEAIISMQHKDTRNCEYIGIGRRHDEGKMNKFDILDYDHDIV